MILEVGSFSDSHNNHIPSSTRPRDVLCGGFNSGADFGLSTITSDPRVQTLVRVLCRHGCLGMLEDPIRTLY